MKDLKDPSIGIVMLTNKVKRLFVFAYFIANNGNDEAGIKINKKYFLPRGEFKKLQWKKLL